MQLKNVIEGAGWGPMASSSIDALHLLAISVSRIHPRYAEFVNSSRWNDEIKLGCCAYKESRYRTSRSVSLGTRWWCRCHPSHGLSMRSAEVDPLRD